MFFSQKVIDVSKKYLPKMAESYNNPKLKLHVGDGFEYMKKHQGEYDVIITDSSDPIGNSKSKITKCFQLQLVLKVLPNMKPPLFLLDQLIFASNHIKIYTFDFFRRLCTMLLCSVVKHTIIAQSQG